MRNILYPEAEVYKQTDLHLSQVEKENQQLLRFL